MSSIELVVVLLAVSAALQIVARRINVPHPVLLVLGGLGLAFVRGLPRIAIPPETLFLLFVPPLLYWAALTTSLRDFWRLFKPIARYATLVVLLTTAAVAVVAHGLLPEFTWAAAFALGTIVAPPDPVAAIAVMRPLGAPRSLVTVLEGEGLMNDATALVSYQIAVAAAVTGSFSIGTAALRLLVAAAGGVAIGFAAGWVIALGRRRIVTDFPTVENTLSLLSPFIAYLPAQWLNVSGVLAVVTLGLYLGRRGPHIVGAATRVQAEAMWTMVQFLLESLTFIFVGLELPAVVKALRSHPLTHLILYGAIITATAIAVRLVYTLVAASVLRLARRRRRAPSPSWREVAFLGWTGLRGGDSLVIALALPLATATGRPFPARDLILFLTFSVILGTLVLQGLTLSVVLRALHLCEDQSEDAEEAHARRIVAQAGLRRLDEATRGDGNAPFVESLRRRYEGRIRRWGVRDRQLHRASDIEHRALAESDAGAAERAERYRALRRAMIDAERDAIVKLRDEGAISDDVMRRVQRELDLETMMLDSGEDDAEDPYGEA